MATTALLTDLYELTMVDAALRSGVADDRAVFEVFARRLPPGRRFGVVAGTGRLVDSVEAFRFGPDQLAFLDSLRILSDDTLGYLERYRFGGSIDGYAEGELYFPGSPVLTVEACFAEAVVLETLVLSVLNHDSAVASAAARMSEAARGASLIEMGGRRTHELAAPDAARAAYLAGFTSTSNLEAGRRYGIPVMGTVAHAFVLSHPDELSAFKAQAEAMGSASTFLVDTYDIATGIRHAVEAAGGTPGAIRIDSGVLEHEVPAARALLDELGATATRIIVTGDLDEERIEGLRDLPVDGFGVGTEVVIGSGAPTVGFVYKLVEAENRAVAKRSQGKSTHGGRKTAWRVLDDSGQIVREVAATGPVAGRPEDAVALQRAYVRAGERVAVPVLDASRDAHIDARRSLPAAARSLSPGAPLLTVEIQEATP
ncbi:MAG TPA: nicotinate phosphoribosyltransferase [Acidimicrobiales bacterium]|nr:nicotinate phosphoribosyltransferase [Acidimicrobiales bacterium]